MPDAAGARRAGGPAQIVETRLTRGVLRVRFVGPVVGQREAPIITRELAQATEEAGRGLRLLVLDLSDVQGVTSMGLATCIDVRNRMHARRVPTVLFGVSPALRDLLKMVKVDRLYRFADSEEDLVRAMAA